MPPLPLLFWRAQGDPATCAAAAQTIRRKDPLRSNRCLDLGIRGFTAYCGESTCRDHKVDTANKVKTFLSSPFLDLGKAYTVYIVLHTELVQYVYRLMQYSAAKEFDITNVRKDENERKYINQMIDRC